MGRILYVARSVGIYGASRMTMHYAIALRRAGHDVTIAYGSASEGGPDSPLQRLRDEDIEMIEAPGFQWAFFPGGCRVIDRLARGADVVISSHLRDIPAAMAAARRNGVRGIAMLQNLPQPGGIGAPVKRWLYRRAINRHANLAVAVSEGVRRHVIENEGAHADRVIAIPNGIDLDAFPDPTGDERRSVRAEFGIGEDERLVVNLARINRQKAQDVLIRAVAEMNAERRTRLTLLIAGDDDTKDGATRREYQTLADRLDVADRFRWIGFRSDVHRLLYGCDASVLPSRWEGLPITMLESMAARTPIVFTEFGTRVDGIRNGENAWQIPAEDVPALARSLEELVDTCPERLAEIGRAGRLIAEEQFSLRRGTEQFVDVVERYL